MARKPLTDVQIRSAKPKAKPYRLPDQFGLFLLVTQQGSKLWRFRYSFNGKDALCSLGSYPEVSLLEARDERDRLRKLVRQGIRPTDDRQQTRQQPTDPQRSYHAVARAWVKEQAEHKEWSPSYRRQVLSTLEKEVFPKVGDKLFAHVTPADFREVLVRLRDRDAKTVAKLIQQWCIAIGNYGVVHGHAEFNTTAAIRGLIKTKPKTHHKPLSEAELPTFFNRMKKGREHKVPLTPQVIGMLERLRAMRLHKRLLFPNIRDRERHMSPTTLNRYLERLGYGGKFSAHGFRATASTLLNTWGLSADAIELQLAHVDKNLTRRSYNQAEHMQERTAIMARWSDYLQSVGGVPSVNGSSRT